MTDTYELSLDYCDHPGVFLAAVLEKQGLRQSQLAERTGLSAKHINQMIKRLIGVSPDVAILLERALGTPADFWVNADAAYQAHQSRLRATAALDSYIPWLGTFNRSALQRHGIVNPTDSTTSMVEKTLRFFRVATPAAFEQSWLRPAVSFRRSQAFSIDEPNTALWLALIERTAADIDVPPLNPRHLRRVVKELPRLTTMTITNGFIAARAALAEAGVALTFVREIDGTRICAATSWISPDRPVIGITERHRKPDTFWFNLLHEVGHVILHPRRVSYLNLDRDNGIADPIEDEADAYAETALFPAGTDEQIRRARSHQDLLLIAGRLGIGVPTIAGRHGKLTGDWPFASRLRGKINDDDIREMEDAPADALT